MQGLMDYSAKKALSFQVRGDGKRYTLMIFSGATQGVPLMYTFTAGAEWQKLDIELARFGAVDFKRVRGIAVLYMGIDGAFRVQIDDLRFD
jgi:hypothetical protein